MAQLDETAREGAWGDLYDPDEERPRPREWDITALFNPRNLSGGLDRVEGMRRLGVAFGAILIVALVFLCFRFAFNAATKAADSRGMARRGQPLPEEDYNSPGAPSGRRGGSREPFVAGGRPGGLMPAPRYGGGGGYGGGAAIPAPVMPPPPAGGADSLGKLAVPAFENEGQRAEVAALVREARQAYDLTRQLDGGPFWLRPRARREPRTDQFERDGAGSADLSVRGAGPGQGPMATAPLGAPMGDGPEAEETRQQVEALSAAVSLSAHPDRYPIYLQADARSFAYEMRVYLRTVDYGLTFPSEQGRLRGSASPHLNKAAEFLGKLSLIHI